MMESLGNLPEEVMISILSRLPAESLLRLKRVSKYWYELISDPKFDSSLKNLCVLVKRTVTNLESGKKEMRFSFLKYPPLTADDHDESVDFPCFGEDFRNSEIHGHSHGLVCIYLFPAADIFIYNPATGDLHKLPPTSLLIGEEFSDDPIDGLYSLTNAVGFGYDPKSKVLKVVRVMDFVESPSNFHPSRAEVYDLGKNEWREIQTPVGGRVRWAPSFEMYYQGFYYWWGVAKIVGRPEIIQWFDMSEEIFGQIPVPQSFHGRDYKYRSMGFLNGSIVLFHYPYSEDDRSFEVWGMDKNNNSNGGVLWSKLFTIGPVSGIQTPLVFVSSHQLLMETTEGQLILYNLKTQHFKHIPLQGHHPCKSQATLFLKTLLSANGGDN